MVISIIALLVSILMPALSGARDQARAVVCLSNVHQLVLGWICYADENDDRLVGGHNGDASSPTKEYDWVQLPHDVAGIPVSIAAATLEDKIRGIESGSIFPYTQNAELYHCPHDRRDMRGVAFRSYGISGSMNGDFGGGWINREYGKPAYTKYSNIRRPSEKYVFLGEKTNIGGVNWGAWELPSSGNRWLDPIVVRHGDVTTLGFADGHAESHSWILQSTLDMTDVPYPDCQNWVAYDGLDDLEYMRKGMQP